MYPMFSSEDIAIFICNSDSIVKETLLEYESLLSDEEKKKISKYRQAQDRDNYLLGRVLLKTVLENSFNIDPNKITTHVGSHGKPYIEGANGIKFNLSHTYNCVVLTISSKSELGIDVEYLNRRINIKNLEGRVFSAKEQKTLNSLPKNEKKLYFLLLWTFKEAYVKLIGLGMSKEFNKLCLSHNQASIRTFTDHDEEKNREQGYKYKSFCYQNEFYISLAARQGTDNIRLFEIVPLKWVKELLPGGTITPVLEN